MPKNMGSTVIKLLIGSFLVGWMLTLFDITPLELLEDLSGTIGEIYSVALSSVRWAADYMLLGAVIVLPLWGVVAGLNYVQAKNRKRNRPTPNKDD